jgi:hypothetical protein
MYYLNTVFHTSTPWRPNFSHLIPSTVLHKTFIVFEGGVSMMCVHTHTHTHTHIQPLSSTSFHDDRDRSLWSIVLLHQIDSSGLSRRFSLISAVIDQLILETIQDQGGQEATRRTGDMIIGLLTVRAPLTWS